MLFFSFVESARPHVSPNLSANSLKHTFFSIYTKKIDFNNLNIRTKHLYSLIPLKNYYFLILALLQFIINITCLSSAY
jgi:hypothetical protein